MLQEEEGQGQPWLECNAQVLVSNSAQNLRRNVRRVSRVSLDNGARPHL